MAVLFETDYKLEILPKDASSAWYKRYEVNSLDDDVLEKIVDWLSNNCIANFVISERRESILSGGYNNNKLAFDMGEQDIKSNRLLRILNLKHTIYLGSIEDDTAFQLTWIDFSK